MQSFSRGLDVIGNNIANVNTTGFKGSAISFSDSFNNMLRAASPGDGNVGNAPAMQIGTGVKVASISSQFSQGALSSTGIPTDLGISGEGFFLVSDPNGTAQYATRAGNFRFDDDGWLVNNSGLRVQGLTGGTAGAPPAAEGSIRIGQTAQGDPVSFSFSKTGQLVEFFEDGTSVVTGQLQLMNFTDPMSLTKFGDGLYGGFDAAGPQPRANPGSNGRGVIESGTIELSNVDLTKEFANMIGIQRSFQASSRLVTVSDGVLEEIVNLKR